MNEALKLLASIGYETGLSQKQAHGSKMPSATKKGPGRYHAQVQKAKNKRKS
jgi:hypothetical protein